jgi:hypothetical protein
MTVTSFQRFMHFFYTDETNPDPARSVIFLYAGAAIPGDQAAVLSGRDRCSAGDTVIGLLILKPIYQIDIAVKRALGAKLGTLKEKADR